MNGGGDRWVVLDVGETIIDETGDIFALEARKRGLELLTEVPAGGLGTVLADGLRLRQVIVNLVNNALKFTERGSVTLSASVTRATETDLRVLFAVRDTGIGIAPENQERVFESFSQEDGSTTRRFGGTGLGLAVVHGIVKSYQGYISVDSEPDKGTAFHVYWPVIKTEAEELRSEVDTDIPQGTERILLVDDEEQTVRMEKQMLSDSAIKFRREPAVLKLLRPLELPLANLIWLLPT